MLISIGKILNIKPEEGLPFSFHTLLTFIFILGNTWAQITLTALFVVQVGRDFIPFMFIGDAIILIFSFAIYSVFADRFSNGRIFAGTATFGAAGVVVGLMLVKVSPTWVAYPFLYLLYRSTTEVISTHWSVYLTDFYDTLTLKRVVPVLASMLRITVIIAAALVPVMNRIATSNQIIIAWGVTLFLTALCVIITTYVFRDTKNEFATSSPSTRPRASYIENLREGFRFVRESDYLRAFAVMAIMVTIVVAVLNIRALEVFETELQTQEAISDLTALITLVGGIAILPFQLFFFSRIVTRLGVGGMNLVFPTLTVMFGILMVLFPVQLAIGIITYFNNTTINNAIRSTNSQLLFNAVPLRVRGRSQAFIRATVAPLGMLIGAIIVYLPLSVGWFLSGVIILSTLGYWIVSMVVTRRYSQALIQLLQEENYAVIFDADDFVIDSTSLNYLKNKLAESSSDDDKIFMAKIISQAARAEAIPILADLIQVGSPVVRAGVVEILVNTGERAKALQTLYTRLIQDEDPTVRKTALIGLERIMGEQSEQYLDLAHSLLSDPDLEVCGHVLPTLLISDKEPVALEILHGFLTSDEPARREMGTRILTKIDSPQFAPLLAERLADPIDSVRLTAVQGIETWGARLAAMDTARAIVIAHLPALILDDPVINIRVAAIRLLEWIDDPVARKLLFTSLGNTRPRIRDEALQVAQRLGKKAIAMLEPVLTNGDAQGRKMATIALAFIQKKPYAQMVSVLLMENLREIYANCVQLDVLDSLATYPSIGILRNVIQENNEDLLDEVILMLSARHSTSAIRAIVTALRSGNSRHMANAIEALGALESLLAIELIPPLFDTQRTPATLAIIGAEKLDIEVPGEKQVIYDLLKSQSTPWFRVVTMFALGEMGSAQIHSPKSVSNLFDVLSEPTAGPSLFSLDEIHVMLQVAMKDEEQNIRVASRAAKRLIEGQDILQAAQHGEHVLSIVERIIFLKSLPFFDKVTVNQLALLATACDERLYQEDTIIFEEGSPGGTLYVVVSGRVGIERQDKTTATSARLQTLGTNSYFGESTFFDNSPMPVAAIAIQNTFTLCLEYGPLVTLMQEYPNLILELLQMMSQRIRTSNGKLAELTRQDQNDVKSVLDKLF